MLILDIITSVLQVLSVVPDVWALGKEVALAIKVNAALTYKD